ncbi:MAG: glycosyltransferase family 2 protein [Clostridiales bacterium]|nr:glycosyltransferase family 2 protein [Clostridiales bacterium]
MCKVVFYTRAYNSEKYIRQTIESVLSQTEKDVRLHIRNNGSTDSTGEIIREYAKKDSRVTFQENKINGVLDEGQTTETPYIESEYVSFLDSDDYIEPNYVEEMYNVAKKIDADIVVCGTTMFMENNPSQKGTRIPPQICTVNMKDVNKDFIALYGSLRPFWGKLFKTEFYFKYEPQIRKDSKERKITNGLDTYFSLNFMKKCNAFASINKALHNYRIRDKSAYHTNIDPYRIKVGEILFYEACAYLKQTEDLNIDNISFLIQVFWAHIKDLIELILLQQNISSDKKLEFLECVLKNELFCRYTSIWENVDIELFEFFGKCVEKAVEGDSEEKLQANREFYIYRLYETYKKIGKNEDEQLFLDIVSSLHSKNNVYMWGAWLLFRDYQNAPDWFLGFKNMSKENIINIIKEV